jgi:flagellar motility protein MotE (MotC chaperone)
MKILKLLKSPIVATLLGTVLYLVVTGIFWKTPAQSEVADASMAPVASDENMKLWNASNPDLELLAQDLKKQKEALDKREVQLTELAARLQTERQELMTVTQVVAQLQNEFNSNVVRVKEEESTNLKKLAKTYAAMTPEGASMIFKELDDVSVVKVMCFMKEAETAPILETIAKQGEMEAKRVATISERIRLSMPRKTTK